MARTTDVLVGILILIFSIILSFEIYQIKQINKINATLNQWELTK